MKLFPLLRYIRSRVRRALGFSEPDFRSAKTLRLPRPRPALRPPAPSPVLVVKVPRHSRLGFKRARLRERLRSAGWRG